MPLRMPPHHDADGHGHERYVPGDRRSTCGDLAEARTRIACETDEQRLQRVAEGPAGDHAVVREHQRSTNDEEPAQHAPATAAEVHQRLDRPLAGTAPHRELGQQHRQTDQQGQRDVKQEEGGPSVLGRQVREAPHVAEADGRSHGGQQEPEARRPLLASRRGAGSFSHVRDSRTRRRRGRSSRRAARSPGPRGTASAAAAPPASRPSSDVARAGCTP